MVEANNNNNNKSGSGRLIIIMNSVMSQLSACRQCMTL